MAAGALFPASGPDDGRGRAFGGLGFRAHDAPAQPAFPDGRT